ncbi:MAG: hypothetical protein JWR13_4415 [Mycobacterium sp.]|nr:hypothetical protein [Mycobacterium sp.]MDT5315762.1 hypothetical protein [Mycobacterium sp.]
MHAVPNPLHRGMPRHGGALGTGSKEHELCIAVLSHCDECGGQLSGVCLVVEWTDCDDRGDTG